MVLGLTLDKGASNATQFQALPRPQQKLHLFAAHEEGIGPRTLSRPTGVPYSIVQRATSDAVRYGSMVCESLPGDEEFETYIDHSEYEKYPEYKHLLRASGTCPSAPYLCKMREDDVLVELITTHA